MQRMHAHFDFERTPVAIPACRDGVRTLLSYGGVASGLAEDLVVAVSEACTNVVEHASGSSRLRLRLHLDRSFVEIRVSDDGAGFSDVAPHMPAPSSTEGRGLALMHALVEEVEVRSSAGRGTEVRLRQQRDGAEEALV